jgi:hypothetical protein
VADETKPEQDEVEAHQWDGQADLNQADLNQADLNQADLNQADMEPDVEGHMQIDGQVDFQVEQ